MEMNIPDPHLIERCNWCDYTKLPCTTCLGTGYALTDLGDEAMKLFEMRMLPVIRELIREAIAEQKGGG